MRWAMRWGITALLLATAACGWQPGGTVAQSPDTCAADAGPTAQTVADAVAAAPPVGSPWTETGRDHTGDCRLYWVQFAPAGATAASPELLLFFDRNTALGSPTDIPRPYTSVVSSGEHVVTVQYQWIVGAEPNCCPTGIGTVRYQIGADGALEALDPIPQP
ncbi:LppP/LprE family lipoprotein [Mycolicibacillus koreensis]|nr:LppP/LprE family lipoprotein [Mycolicibacillus koreensis]